MEELQDRSIEEPALSATTVFASLAELRDAPGYSPKAITERLINSLGSDAAAPLLGVSQELLNRWASGRDAPDAEGRLQLADLDALVGHLHSAFTPAQAMIWMCGYNGHLGARPIDVYRTQGSAPVIGAIRAHAHGA
ncbi:hypothetical protein QFZ79_003151 [Arthrobacter sp. V4I6]|uniref:hypothetical protein n=1 Tax=unclassified Arthrobacter TaxID=235627 RepID=UPI002789C821|nr:MULTISPECIES: hypothetical protein [unclassified Arthrobacter]MDQ0820778.1 hypothetical protein [Arthrobacter sp. V1I7]MDQ0855040.1 hypothetical protein [Arthrobacter sp. V4I6]